MEINRLYNENCIETLGRMPDGFLDCVITSPPYWQLRDYGVVGQWGLEGSVDDYLGRLWGMMDLLWDKLKEGGSVWINLGDTYNGNKVGNTSNKGYKDGEVVMGVNKVIQRFPEKSLLLIPHRFAIGCIDRGWILRNDIVWAKRNGMPESVLDRFSKKHEYMFFMVKTAKYYFDLDSVKDRTLTFDLNERDRDLGKMNKVGGRSRMGGLKKNDYLLKNPGDVSDFWDIPTRGNSLEHYASYSDGLIRKPILAGCPEGGLVYDPFMGTGSTAEVAIRSGRNWVGSEISLEYCRIAGERLDKFKNRLF